MYQMEKFCKNKAFKYPIEMEYKRVLKDRKIKLSLLSSEMGEFDIEKIKKKIMGDK